jgi:hypothetical protein
MIRTLRAFFLGRLLREKLLLVAFFVIGVLMWFSGYSKRLGTFWREQRLTTVNLAEQQRWLDNRKVIELSAQKSAKQLDAAQTLDATRLLAVVGSLSAELGLRNTNSGQQRRHLHSYAPLHDQPRRLRLPEEILRGHLRALALHRPRAVLDERRSG